MRSASPRKGPIAKRDDSVSSVTQVLPFDFFSTDALRGWPTLAFGKFARNGGRWRWRRV